MTESASKMSDQEILERFATIVANSLKIDASLVTEDAYLDDLGADSLDFLEITLETESAFRISIPDKNILKTGEEVLGPDILEKEGILTEEGKRFLKKRMPELSEEELSGEVRMDDVNHRLTRVDTWVRMIKGLLEHTPAQCPECGGELENTPTGRLKCVKCSAEVEIPSGEELNKRWVQNYYENEYLPRQSSSAAS
ncbi:MAG TPA: phosphopantetheine-binding protein [Acidobacteriota bacterium]|nr:phosphopantetheine-binding protein [Acidobacteriota bacterium]